VQPIRLTEAVISKRPDCSRPVANINQAARLRPDLAVSGHVAVLWQAEKSGRKLGRLPATDPFVNRHPWYHQWIAYASHQLKPSCR
jgi:hypothetical protein